MRLTVKQLRLLILEYKEMLAKGHLDGQPWSGSLEDLASVQSRTWGHGDVVDAKGYSDLVSLAMDYTKGTVKNMFEEEITVQQLRQIIKEQLAFLREAEEEEETVVDEPVPSDDDDDPYYSSNWTHPAEDQYREQVAKEKKEDERRESRKAFVPEGQLGHVEKLFHIHFDVDSDVEKVEMKKRLKEFHDELWEDFMYWGISRHSGETR